MTSRGRRLNCAGMKVHLQVFWRALVFGLGVYAVVRALVFVTAEAGVFEWFR